MQELAEQATVPMLNAYYSAGVPAPETLLSDVPFVALDLETTGLDPHEAAIVSVGLVPFTLRRIRMAESRYWVVRPRRELDQESVLIHRITHDELDAAPRFSAILPELLQALAGCMVVVHYRHIERPFLDQACRRWIGEGLEFPLIDTMAIEGWMLRRGRTRTQRLAERLGWWRRPSVRLGACRERYHLPAYSAHHALTDALATAELFQAQYAWRLGRNWRLEQLWL